MYLVQLLRTCCAVAILGAITRSGVIVVDAAGGGQFTQIAPAVAAAQDGDTILVKAGSYARFTVTNKSLTIVADSGADVNVEGPLEVRSLVPSRTVVLGGLTVHSDGLSSDPFSIAALVLAYNTGAIRVHGCSFLGRTSCAFPDEAARIVGCQTGVAFVDCVFRGEEARLCDFCCDSEGADGGDALHVESSKVALYDCDLEGGDGSYGEGQNGGDGGAAAHIEFTSFLHASGSTFQGGDGGWGCDWLSPTLSGAGGDGIWMDANSIAWILESPAFAGAPGYQWNPPWACTGTPNQGAPGQPFDGPGTYFGLPVQKLVMEAPSLVREGQDLPLTIRGEPGVAVFLFIADETLFSGAASWRGILVPKKVGMLQHVMVLGTMPPSGVMTVGLDLPDLPPGVGADTRFLQVWRRGSNGRVLGSFAALTVLDSAY